MTAAEGFGPRCARCGLRTLVRLARYSDTIDRNTYGCTHCHLVQRTLLGEVEPTLAEQLALSLVLRKVAP